MNRSRLALLLVLISQGCLLEDGRTLSADAGPDATGSGGVGGASGTTGTGGGVAGSGGSQAGTGGASGTGGSATGGAAGSTTTGTGGSATGGGAGTGGAGGSGGTAGGSGAGAGGSTLVDSGIDIRRADAADASTVDTGIADRAGGDACTSPPTLDTDGDGTPDCTDGCPRDIRKIEPGACGCNFQDPIGGGDGGIGCLRAALVHRYSFNAAGGSDAGATDAGPGTVVLDSVGTAHGTARGGANAVVTNGTVVLSGDVGAGYTNEGYVNLPADVLNGLTNATLEVWVTWRGAAGGTGAAWQRIFDFGDQQAAGTSQNGRTYLFLTPSSGTNMLRMTWSSNGPANETIIEQGALPTGMLKHVAVVLDDASGSASLCVDGACGAPVSIMGALRLITPINNWLGRSNFSVDPELNGIIHEFRIYNAPLRPDLLRTSFMAGPDAPL
jgi:hypothetical protein